MIYRGIRCETLADPIVFKVQKDRRIEEITPAMSQKLVNHSPTGFQWGYSGSGPAQLALALLLDATQDSKLALRYHQEFKDEIVAGWKERWEISQDRILDWLRAKITGTQTKRLPNLVKAGGEDD